MPHHPIYTKHSPVTKLSTYMGIVDLIGYIIRATNKTK